MVARLSLDEAEAGILAGDRGVLARSITLVESQRDSDQRLGEALVARLLPHTGRARRVGLSGPPGVGKSSFIDALGSALIEAGKRVAVLAVDPSSARSGGSILGDKTRMPRLAVDPRAFVRPSPAGEHLGGVARRTREAMVLCEAFGFDVVLVETVGVGQSETEVASMVDCFVLLALAGAGDELQGIKRGIMEMVDIVAVNKADGDNAKRAKLAARDLANALHYLRRRFEAWEPRAQTTSALTGEGVLELWASVEAHRAALEGSGELDELRRSQSRRWLWALVEEGLVAGFRSRPEVARKLAELEPKVLAGQLPATTAARALIELYAGRCSA